MADAFTKILLIPSQMPQQELAMVAQLLQTQGYIQQSEEERKKNVHEIVFHTQDKANAVSMKFFQELGVLRLEFKGELSIRISMALTQYLEPLSVDAIVKYLDEVNSDMERRVYMVLLTIAFQDATAAYMYCDKKYLSGDNEAMREGFIQGVAFLETPDAGPVLEELEKKFAGKPTAELARKAINALSERGLITESVQSLKTKIEACIDDNPQSALDILDKCNPMPPQLRYLRAKALRLLHKTDEAFALLKNISGNEPDAAQAFAERAILHEQNGELAAAHDDILDALTLDAQNPAFRTVYDRLELILKQQNASAEQRVRQLTQAIERAQGDPNLLFQRAECYLSMNQPHDAIQDLKGAERLAPNDPRLPAMKAEADLQQEYFGSALYNATIARKTFAPSARIQAQLLKPRVFFALNNPHAALNLLRELLNTDPDCFPARFGVAIALELLGDKEKAIKTLATIPSGELENCIRTLRPVVYEEIPVTQEFCGKHHIDILPKPEHPMGKEPSDPLFKRCCQCGALTMKRRTFCKDCSNNQFFE